MWLSDGEPHTQLPLPFPPCADAAIIGLELLELPYLLL
jgi:hypothetical protein